MDRLADIHCHILPYVDDGAEHKEEMEKLLSSAVEQGIRVVCTTPHLRSGMFESTDEAVVAQFQRVSDYIHESGLPVELFLGREYFCDGSFLERLHAGKLIPMGRGETVLSEFSGRYTADKIRDFIKAILDSGLRPLVAHVERYQHVTEDDVQSFVDLGARIQINAGSVLGREGRGQKKMCWSLMKRGLVHVVASDAHDPVYRPNELGLCADKIEHKLGQAYARKIMWDNPVEILSLDKGE